MIAATCVMFSSCNYTSLVKDRRDLRAATVGEEQRSESGSHNLISKAFVIGGEPERAPQEREAN